MVCVVLCADNSLTICGQYQAALQELVSPNLYCMSYLAVNGRFNPVAYLLPNALEKVPHAHVITIVAADDPDHPQSVHGGGQCI